MIDIGFFEDGTGMIVKGHANTAPKGSDLVCCAVSTLFETAVAYSRSLKEDKVISDYEVKQESGDCMVRMQDTGGLFLLRPIYDGCEWLRQTYPAIIRVGLVRDSKTE